DHGRVGVAQGRDGDAGDEVEILATVDVPDPHAVPVVDGQRWRPVVGHHDRVPPVLQLAHFVSSSGRTIVPTPSVVNTSSSSACGTRPSRTWALVTPPSTARRQASILGAMPLD